MKNNNKKGFTLIELLAVIVILAIIALIATPLILGVIEDSRKDAFKNNAYGIISSGEIFLATNIGKINNIDFSIENESDWANLNYKGDTPTEGRIIIDSKGKSHIILKNKKYCAYQNTINKNDKEIIVTTKLDDENCDISLMESNTIGNKCPGEKEITTDCIDIDEYGFLSNNRCGNKIIIPEYLNGIKIRHVEKDLFKPQGTPLDEVCIVVETSDNYIPSDFFPIYNIGKVSLILPDNIKDFDFPSYQGIYDKFILPKNLENLYGGPYYATFLNTLILPGTIKELQGKTFQNINLNKGIKLNEGLITIEGDTFVGITLGEKHSKITIPSSVIRIGSNAFNVVNNYEVVIKGDDCNKFGSQNSPEFENRFGRNATLICE